MLKDRDEVQVIGTKLTALDIKAKSDMQYGFKMEWDNKSLIFLVMNHCQKICTIFH